jgi:predicted AAA+ superfamily ATPase
MCLQDVHSSPSLKKVREERIRPAVCRHSGLVQLSTGWGILGWPQVEEFGGPPGLEGHPEIGASWEGFVLLEAVSLLGARWRECYFWATHSGAELDLLFNRGRQRIGIVIKRTSAPRPTKSMLIAAAEDLGLRSLYVIHAGTESFPMAKGIQAVPLGKMHEVLRPLK